MRQSALCVTYHQDFSNEGSSEQVIEVNNPTGKELGLLEITSWILGNDVLLLKGDYPTQIPKQEHSLQDIWNNPLLRTGKPSEVPSLWIYGISGNRISRRIVVSQGPSLGSAEERSGHRQDFRKREMVSFSPEPKRLWWHVTDPWAVSRGIAQRRRGPRLRAGLEHTFSLELKEPREKPLWPTACFTLGEFLCFLSYRPLGIYTVGDAWESDSRGPILLWPGDGCPQAPQDNNDTLLGLPMCICHDYASSCTTHHR